MATQTLLTRRLHIDLQRLTSAACRTLIWPVRRSTARPAASPPASGMSPAA